MTTPTHFAAIPSELGQAASLAPVGPLVSHRWRGVNLASGGVESRNATYSPLRSEHSGDGDWLPPWNVSRAIADKHAGRSVSRKTRKCTATPSTWGHYRFGTQREPSRSSARPARLPFPHLTQARFVTRRILMLAVGACASFGGRATFHPHRSSQVRISAAVQEPLVKTQRLIPQRQPLQTKWWG
jgi:hypothetical protein